MTDAILFTFAVSLVLIALWYMLPFLIGIGVLAAIFWAAGKGLDGWLSRRHSTAAAHKAVAARADTQHNKIMSGDLIGGVYGEYLPPAGLR